MKEKDILKDDPLKNYIDHLKIEKAPEGFSLKLMSLIYMETKVAKEEKKYSIPLISWIVITILTCAALLLPTGSISISFFELPSDINLNLPELKTGFEIPDIIIPVLSGIVMLFLFDVLLKGLFRKRKYQD